MTSNRTIISLSVSSSLRNCRACVNHLPAKCSLQSRLSWLTNGTVLSTRTPLKPRVRILEAANKILSLENWGHRRLLFPEVSIAVVAGATDLSCSKDLAFRPSLGTDAGFLTVRVTCTWSPCQKPCLPIPKTVPAFPQSRCDQRNQQLTDSLCLDAQCLGLGSFVESTLFFYSLDLKVLAKSQTKSFYQISS